MADPTLHDNGEPCPACELRREAEDKAAILRSEVPCNNCGGTGRVGFSDAVIVERSAAWARKHYWPAFDRRNGLA